MTKEVLVYVVLRVFFFFALICVAYVTAMLIIRRYFFKPNWARLFSKIEDPDEMVRALRKYAIVDINDCTTCPKCRGRRVEISGYFINQDASAYEDGNCVDNCSGEEFVRYAGIVDVECEDCRYKWTVDSNERSVQDY